MAQYLSPGIYTAESNSNIKPTQGVSTSIAGLIGMAERGPVVGPPLLVTNFADFQRIYGGYLPAGEFGDYRYLAYAVEHFFTNGGTRAFITRVAPQDALCAQGYAPSSATHTSIAPTSVNPVSTTSASTGPLSHVLKLTAKNPGLWGNKLSAVLLPASKAKTQIYEVLETSGGYSYSVKNAAGFFRGDIVAFTDNTQVIYNRVVKIKNNIITFEIPFKVDVTDRSLLPGKVIATCEFNMEICCGYQVESYENLSLNAEIPNFIESKMAKSDLVNVEYIRPESSAATPEAPLPPFSLLATAGALTATISFSGGSNGTPQSMTAADFIGTDNGAGKRTGLQSFLDNDQVSIIAAPGITDPKVQLALTAHCEKLANRFAVLDIPRDMRRVQDIIDHRNIFDTTYAALYHPWLTVFDSLEKRNIHIPPSGSVMGIYARTDNARGVHKAPANEAVRACVGLDIQFGKGELDILNPKGVNLIRSLPGIGIRVWGARTAGSNASWKYVNIRRLFIYIEESIKANTNWVIFEPNDEGLWGRVQRGIEGFLSNLWREGALAGSSPEEAFFVNIGHSTMTQDDIDNGRLICMIGVAPVKPAEFVIFRVTQNTAEAQ